MNVNQVANGIRQLGLTTVLAMALASSATADDIDVYTAQLSGNKKPNILFVLDYSGSMGRAVNGWVSPRNPSKIDILKNAMRYVLDDNFERINAGIGSLYSYSTTGVRWPVSELNADAHSVDPNIPSGQFTVRDIMVKQIEERGAGGSTATVDALVEAAQYFRGEPVTHNDANPRVSRYHQPHQWNTRQERYTGGRNNAAIAVSYSPTNAYSTDRRATYYCNDFSAAGGPNYCENKLTQRCEVRNRNQDPTPGFELLQNLWGSYQRCEYRRTMDWVGARYNSPIANACQANAIVLISDGQPTIIRDGDSLRSITGTGINGCQDLSRSIFRSRAGSRMEGNCGPEILRLLSGNDQNPDIPNSHVTTYTVGFDIDGPGQDYLTLLAEAGEGTFFRADNPEDLTNALTTVVDEVLGGSENFTELSIDVDKANFSHDNRAYFNLFTPSVRQGWSGNLKGYFLNASGLMDINGQAATVATEAGTQFAESAQSFWSSEPDGNNVTEGGASEQIVSGSRNLYTYPDTSVPSQGVNLSRSNRFRLRAGNRSLSAALLGVPGNRSLRNSALNWIQNAPMGDPLHSKSVTINYADRRVVYVMTNQGLIHAIDASSPSSPGSSDSSGGQELFAFMPRRLLRNLPDLSLNRNSGDHIYGLDGALTRWHTDTNNDGIVNNGESVLLVFGMRRGGNAYYALDVSSPASPRLQWIIDDNHPDFSALAQSWSRMSLITVNDRGGRRQVLAFAAGYDAAIQDAATGPTPSSGNAIYMVDRSGELVWSATSADHAAMQYAIPSDLTIIDSDQDALADRMYVGDVAGQVWRVDFDDISRRPVVSLLANLDDGHHQPFFYPPSVALNNGRLGQFLSVSLGSGNRTNPLLSGSRNKLYMIKDTNIGKGAPGSSRIIRPNDLYDATDNLTESMNTVDASQASRALDNAEGWMVALAHNEKALSRLVTFEGKLLATTFEAVPPADVNSCGLDTVGKFYAMDIETAQPARSILPADSSAPAATTGSASRYRQLRSTGIPSSPVVIFPKGSGAAQIIVDKETVSRVEQTLTSVFWHGK